MELLHRKDFLRRTSGADVGARPSIAPNESNAFGNLILTLPAGAAPAMARFFQKRGA
jgi:hypothetical protein